MLTTTQFERAKRLALMLGGIELAERHRVFLERRCQRLGLLDGNQLDLLLGAVEGAEPSALRRFIGLVTTRHTSFFRHPLHFDLAARHALAAAHQGAPARLWSAGAATGEEPYSLAMTLIEVSGTGQPPASILASDLDQGALTAAERGEYTNRAMSAMKARRRTAFFSNVAPDRWSVAPVVRRLIEFRPINLIELTWPVEQEFDVIFCRNVLMYLEGSHRYAVLERMASLLSPEGLLFLDPAENLGAASQLFSPGPGNACYRRRVKFRNPGAAKRLI